MAAKAATAKKWLDKSRIAEHGQYIFFYTSPRTHQIVYSLTPALNTHRALKQLPFLGKNTKNYPQTGVPTRKDLHKTKKPGYMGKDPWRPLAAVSFPSGAQGLAAFKQLREFRKRHELEWNDAEIDEDARLLLKERERIDEEIKDLDDEYYQAELQRRQSAKPTKARLKPLKKERPYWWDPTKLYTRNRRERAQVVMMISKANSIADLAAVLSYQDEAAKEAAEKITERREKNKSAVLQAQQRIDEIMQLKPKLWADGTEESLARYKALKREKMWLQRAMMRPDPYAALAGFYSWLNDPYPPSKRGPGRIRRCRDMTVFTMRGVKIEWANILDAQYASSWPESVKHDVLAQSKHSKYKFVTELQPPRAQKLIEAIREEPDESLDESQDDHVEPQKVPTVMERLANRLKYGATT